MSHNCDCQSLEVQNHRDWGKCYLNPEMGLSLLCRAFSVCLGGGGRGYSLSFVGKLDLHFVSRVILSLPQTSNSSSACLLFSCAHVRSGVLGVGVLSMPAPSSAGSRLHTPASQWTFTVCSLALSQSRQVSGACREWG